MNLSDLIERIKLPQLDLGCYNLSTWIGTALGIQALENDYTLYAKHKSGFLKGELKDLLNEFDPDAKILFDNGKHRKIYYTKHTIIQVENDGEEGLSFEALSTSKEEHEKICGLLKDRLEETKKNTVSVLTQEHGAFYLSPIGTLASPLIRENYIDEVVKSFDFVVKDFKSNNPFGRLVVINGEPGTGKSYLIRGLVNELENSTMVLMPPRLIADIDGPTLLPTFINERSDKEKSITLIIEDADSCLAERATDNISSISSLLNYTDGILGSLLDLRIIATTNQKSIEFDPALTRPGRLSRHIEIGSLSAAKATEIYQRLTKTDDFSYTSDGITLAQIYAKAIVETDGEFLGIKNDPDFDPDPGSKMRKSYRSMGFGR